MESSTLRERKFFDRFAVFVLAHPGGIIAAVAIITLLAGYQLTQATFGSSLLQAFMEDRGEYTRYLERAEAFDGHADDLIYVGTREGDDLLTPAILNALRAAARELARHPDVERITSLVDTPTPNPKFGLREAAARRILREQLRKGNIALGGADLKAPLVWPESADEQARVDLQRLRADLLTEPSIAGLLISHDATAQALIVKLKDSSRLSIAEQGELRDSIESTLRGHGLGKEGVYAAGVVISQSWMFHEMRRGIFVLFPIATLLVAAIVCVFFRRAVVVVVTTAVCVIASLWALGATVALFGELSVLVAAAPLVIVVVTTSDIIHLSSVYATESAAGLPKEQALRRTVADVGGACILTGITAFIGFISLAAVPVPTTRHFAFASAIGTACALLLCVTLVPIAFAWTKQPLAHHEYQFLRGIDAWLQRVVDRCRRVSLDHSWGVIGVCAILTLLSAALMTRLEFTADFPARFSHEHPQWQGAEFFDKYFSGTSNIEVLYSAHDGSLLEPKALRLAAQFEDAVQQLPGVRSVSSLTDHLRATDRLIGFESDDDLPATQQSAEAVIRWLEKHDEYGIRSFVTSDRQLARMFVQVTTNDFLEGHRIAQRIDELAAGLPAPDVEFDVTGTLSIVGGKVHEIIRSELNGFLIGTLSIGIVMALGFRSLRVGFWSQIPNLLPLFGLGALVAIARGDADSDMFGLPIVALGLASDDTIHVLHRYHLEQETGGGDRRAVLDRTFQYTGRAIILAALVLCIGLLPCALSSYLGIWMLGTYLVATLAYALLADLLLLPALLNLGVVDFGHGKSAAARTIDRDLPTPIDARQ